MYIENPGIKIMKYLIFDSEKSIIYLALVKLANKLKIKIRTFFNEI